ncbi:MAG: response regulator transcription factor [Candidatus Eremiobacteraeota bacterium]|jgi:two-component system response regulator NreC|nr:response regulator transcription factor [Candidatus Eremiobacteraeota bacterium]MCL5055592.1 response regulator transcription factor [Bacillota bacterium]
MISILIADDHRILREGLKSLMETDPEIQVVGEASNGQEAVDMTRELHPNLVLLDIGMPVMNGLEATKAIKQLFPEIKILILTQHDSQEYFFKVLEYGASGYILKDTASTELLLAIKTVSEGKSYLSPGMTQTLIQGYFQMESRSHEENLLTSREQEIFDLLTEGATTREISKKLFISVKTVQTHLAHVMEKLGLDNRSELIKYAIKKGIIVGDKS